MPKVYQSAFTVACFTGLSDVLGCSGSHQKALAGLNRKLTSREWPHGAIVILAVDLATFCGIYSTIGPQSVPLTSMENFDKR